MGIQPLQLMIFYYVIELQSVTKAAQYLGCPKAKVSKQLALLERAVGMTLIHRNTRNLKLNFAGEALFEHAKSMVLELKYTEHTISALQDKPEGALTVTSPMGYAHYILAPQLSKFLEDYPKINLKMLHSGEYVDLVKEKIDIAIRITHEPPLDRVAKKIGMDKMVICASPAYLKQQGEPQFPRQLQKHACLVYSSQQAKTDWPFEENGLHYTFPVLSRLSSNSIELLLNAALHGLGIVRLPSFSVQEKVKEGRLKILLSQYHVAETPIYAIFLQSRIIPPKVYAFIHFLENLHKQLEDNKNA